jgi:hypothetical protein
MCLRIFPIVQPASMPLYVDMSAACPGMLPKNPIRAHKQGKRRHVKNMFGGTLGMHRAHHHSDRTKEGKTTKSPHTHTTPLAELSGKPRHAQPPLCPLAAFGVLAVVSQGFFKQRGSFGDHPSNRYLALMGQRNHPNVHSTFIAPHPQE